MDPKYYGLIVFGVIIVAAILFMRHRDKKRPPQPDFPPPTGDPEPREPRDHMK